MRRRTAAMGLGIVLALVAGWWLSRGAPVAAVDPPGETPPPPRHVPVEPLAAWPASVPPAERAANDVPDAASEGGDDAACVPLVSETRPSEGRVIEVTVRYVGEDGPDAPHDLSVSLAWRRTSGRGFDRPRAIGRSAGPVFFVRPCGAHSLLVRMGNGPLQLVEFSEADAMELAIRRATPPFVVTGRLVHQGQPLASAPLGCTRGIGMSERDGRFTVDCDQDGLLRLIAPWKTATPLQLVRPPDGGALDVGDVVVLRRPPVEPGKIGLDLEQLGGETVVRVVGADTPAAVAGLRKGDVLLEIDGHAIASVEEGIRLIPGAPGTPLRLKVRRGADIFLVDLVRQPEAPLE